MCIRDSDWGWAPVGSLSFAQPFYFRLDDPEHKLFIAVEQPELLEFTKTMKRWNDKGFFSKSVLSNKTASIVSFKAGKRCIRDRHVTAVLELADKETGAELNLPGGLKTAVRYGWLAFELSLIHI